MKGGQDTLDSFIMKQMVIQFNTLPLHHTYPDTY